MQLPHLQCRQRHWSLRVLQQRYRAERLKSLLPGKLLASLQGSLLQQGEQRNYIYLQVPADFLVFVYKRLSMGHLTPEIVERR